MKSSTLGLRSCGAGVRPNTSPCHHSPLRTLDMTSTSLLKSPSFLSSTCCELSSARARACGELVPVPPAGGGARTLDGHRLPAQRRRVHHTKRAAAQLLAHRDVVGVQVPGLRHVVSARKQRKRRKKAPKRPLPARAPASPAATAGTRAREARARARKRSASPRASQQRCSSWPPCSARATAHPRRCRAQSWRPGPCWPRCLPRCPARACPSASAALKAKGGRGLQSTTGPSTQRRVQGAPRRKKTKRKARRCAEGLRHEPDRAAHLAAQWAGQSTPVRLRSRLCAATLTPLHLRFNPDMSIEEVGASIIVSAPFVFVSADVPAPAPLAVAVQAGVTWPQGPGAAACRGGFFAWRFALFAAARSPARAVQEKTGEGDESYGLYMEGKVGVSKPKWLKKDKTLQRCDGGCVGAVWGFVRRMCSAVSPVARAATI